MIQTTFTPLTSTFPTMLPASQSSHLPFVQYIAREMNKYTDDKPTSTCIMQHESRPLTHSKCRLPLYGQSMNCDEQHLSLPTTTGWPPPTPNFISHFICQRSFFFSLHGGFGLHGSIWEIKVSHLIIFWTLNAAQYFFEEQNQPKWMENKCPTLYLSDCSMFLLLHEYSWISVHETFQTPLCEKNVRLEVFMISTLEKGRGEYYIKWCSTHTTCTKGN